MKGTMSGGMGFDSAGPLAKSVQDCADVMNVLLPGRDFRSHLTNLWEGIRIAYLDYKAWQFADWICDQGRAFDDEHEIAMMNALKTAQGQGAKVCYHAKLLMPDKIMGKYGTVPMWTLYNRELPFGFKRFLALFNNTGLRTLQDLVDFNKKHAELELPSNQPSQSSFESALEDNMSDDEYVSDLRHLRQSFRDAVEDMFQETGADVVMA
ncbi:Amidase signature domain protein [Metarhizium guizhouense ARSEF 977]|uniref:Amidase signature domain protein n=1 Tax=Metarhizium guizhouense (strain ARSEF 977) TaxID=1276136 RepID=A0A0B4GMW2_METGA|nr:Amidase signature domain protein [Metarhizium guizhouense ARSEF 977]